MINKTYYYGIANVIQFSRPCIEYKIPDLNNLEVSIKSTPMSVYKAPNLKNGMHTVLELLSEGSHILCPVFYDKYDCTCKDESIRNIYNEISQNLFTGTSLLLQYVDNFNSGENLHCCRKYVKPHNRFVDTTLKSLCIFFIQALCYKNKNLIRAILPPTFPDIF
jgi:hypothetical protein